MNTCRKIGLRFGLAMLVLFASYVFILTKIIKL